MHQAVVKSSKLWIKIFTHIFKLKNFNNLLVIYLISCIWHFCDRSIKKKANQLFVFVCFNQIRDNCSILILKGCASKYTDI